MKRLLIALTAIGPLHLICRAFRHDWRPAGMHYRCCERCHLIEAVQR